MNLVTTVNAEHKIVVSLSRNDDGQIEECILAVLAPQEARAFAGHLVALAGLAELAKKHHKK